MKIEEIEEKIRTVIKEIEEKIRAGAAKFGFSLYPGNFINKENKTCCVIAALALNHLDDVSDFTSDIIDIMPQYELTQGQTYALEGGFENWDKSNNSLNHPELYQLGIRLRSEIIRVEQLPEE